ncbi:hypothetical protein EJ08DRAFT_700807 [Tothia fuscella]|uniref:Tat pathway signal sequence n=1 Tax=Tothia fuscella TaxID=1048955 RepID=A0A9P4TVG7_9PEZI|nr:hypothetical protein EJ08DRAFT_700807 [Tothia fuscella]
MTPHPPSPPESVHNEEEKALLSDSFKDTGQDDKTGRSFWTVLLGGLLIASLMINVIFLLLVLRSQNLNRVCSRYTEQYSSPILDAIDITYSSIPFDGNFSHRSVYAELNVHSNEVDEAWTALGADLRGVVIPEDKGERFGLSQSQVKIDIAEGGGFVANIEAMHHVHCLNVLRQTSVWNYEHYLKEKVGLFANSEPVVISHAGHCLNIIRQQLMCGADTSIFGQWWVKDIGAWVDFNTQHKCKNFDDIRTWVEQNQVPETARVRWREGDKELDEIP